MLSLVAGSYLNFDGLTAENLPAPQTSVAEVDVPQPRARLSTCNIRLSFGDLDPGFSPRPADHRTRQSASTDKSSHGPGGFGKYDTFLLKDLFCYHAIQYSPFVEGNATANESRTIFRDNQTINQRLRPKSTSELIEVRKYSAAGTPGSGDDFVIIRDNYLLHGRGIEEKYRVVEEIHRKDKAIIDSVWCTFRHRPREVKPEHATITPVYEPFEPVEALCIAEQRKIHVHRSNGERHSHATAFPIRKLWAFSFGLLIERDTKVASNLAGGVGYPNLFSTLTHLEESSPILFLGNARAPHEMSVLVHRDSEVAGVSDGLPLVLLFDPSNAVHSLWLARLTTAEEMEAAADLIGKEHLADGETLHFHGTCESPRLRSRNNRQTSLLSPGTSLDSQHLSPGFTISPRPLLPNESAKRTHSLHREVLLASGRKFTPNDGSSTALFASPKYVSPGVLNSLETPNESGSASRTNGNLSSSSAVVSMDMSMSMNVSARSSLGLVVPSRTDVPLQGSPNAPAHTLRDVRSPIMSFSQSKINSIRHDSHLENGILSSGPGKKSRSNSLSHPSHKNAKKLTRVTHPCPSAQPITDELAFPKLTFVHVFSDSISSSRPKPGKDCFEFVDCFHRTYFCYVLPANQELRCIRLRRDVLEDGRHLRISSGNVIRMPAISAIKLSNRNLMVVLEPSRSIRLYASPTVPLLLVDLSLRSVGDINFFLRPAELPGNLSGPTTSSPHLSKTAMPVFSPHFSPVPDNVLHTPNAASSASRLSEVQYLTPCSGSKFLAHTDAGTIVLRVPPRPSSDVIEMCLDGLREHLDADLYGLILVEVSKLGFDSRNRSVTLKERWNLFFTGLLTRLACSVSRVADPAGGDRLTSSAWKQMKKQSDSMSTSDPGLNAFQIVVDRNVPYITYCPAVLLTLHLVSEEIQLCSLWREELLCMLPWLCTLSTICELPAWTAHYEQQMTCLAGNEWKSPPSSVVFVGQKRPSTSVKRLSSDPASPISFLEQTLRGRKGKFPVAKHVNPLSKKVVQIVTTLSQMGGTMTKEQQLDILTALLRKEAFTDEDYQFLPKTLQIALQRVFSDLCEQASFEKLPVLIYQIAKREDALKCKKIVDGLCAGDFCAVDIHHKIIPSNPEGGLDADTKRKAQPLSRSLITKRFANDARVREAERLLVTSDPVVIPLNAMHSANEVEFRKSQESWLKSVATRTMALPVARGMLSLGSEYAYATEKLNAPEIVYSGVERGGSRNVTLKSDDLPSGYENWPRFHNGVATGLRLRHYRGDSVKFDHHWLAFNAGQQSKRDSIDCAGMFLGMALNGLIDLNTDPVELHNLLIRLEDPVSIAVILGMACVKRGSQDKKYYRMIGLHIITFVPDSGIELVIPQNIHVASLLALGLLYRGSANRFISERLLAEIWSGNTADINGEAMSKEGTSAERESTSLSAALGLGFVLLGLGNKNILGLADLAIPQRLRTLVTGGWHGKSNAQTKRSEGGGTGYSPPRSRDIDEQSINTHITAPGAILALGMIFMKTERQDIADWMAMPGTLHELDEIRPDFLLLRVVARSLIMWNTVEATEKWVNSNFPIWILKNVFLSTADMEKDGHDVVSITQAYFYILAGCCMALGLKFAGTALDSAKRFLLKITSMMTKWSQDSALTHPINGRCSYNLVQTCLTTILIAVASVMAGTGDLDVFRVLRYMHGRPRGSLTLTYGHQMGVHMAIGLLFLGSGMYTLGTSCEALAAMLVAFFPMWPKNANDNRYHMQAFRHLYVLAVESRLVTTRSVYNGDPVQTTVRVKFLDTEKESFFITPCVLPELSKLAKISIASGRHWLIFTGSDNWTSLKKLITEEGIVVYPPSGSLRKDNLALTTMMHSIKDHLTAHFDLFMSQPVDSRADIVRSFKKFLHEYPKQCPDKGVIGLFQVASYNISSENSLDQWMAWVIYQCSVHEDMTALMEIVAYSLNNLPHWQRVVDVILRLTCDDRDKSWQWKRCLKKDLFAQKFSTISY